MINLEEEIDHTFTKFKINGENKSSIRKYLDLLKLKDNATYEHSLRVGLLGVKIAEYMHLDPKPLLFAGVCHDVGKILIAPEILKKTEGFNEGDMKLMKKHPEYSYKFLRGVHEFSAEIALRHHRYQEGGYPKKLPKQKVSFSKNTHVMIDFFARILSLADFYDAVTSRVNDKFGEKKKLSSEESKNILLKKNKDSISA